MRATHLLQARCTLAAGIPPTPNFDSSGNRQAAAFDKFFPTPPKDASNYPNIFALIPFPTNGYGEVQIDWMDAIRIQYRVKKWRVSYSLHAEDVPGMVEANAVGAINMDNPGYNSAGTIARVEDERYLGPGFSACTIPILSGTGEINITLYPPKAPEVYELEELWLFGIGGNIIMPVGSGVSECSIGSGSGGVGVSVDGNSIGGQVIDPVNFPMTGSIVIDAAEYWEYRDDRGRNPLYDSITGEPL